MAETEMVWWQKIRREVPLWAVVVGIGIATFIVCLSSFWLYRESQVVKGRVIDSAYMQKERDAYKVVDTDPRPLQALFEEDVQSGVKDQYTQSHAYVILNRYFNNGGNIYEIYDYVNSRPALVFMKHAENIYPPVFQSIKDHALPPTFSPEGMYAYLAYLEALDRAGYGNVLAQSTAAHEYAQMAYVTQKQPERLAEGVNATQNIQFKINKALFFAEEAKEDVAKILDGTLTTKDLSTRDMIVGVSHYGTALRYFQALGVDFSSPKTSKEAFAFCMREANKPEFRSLERFTGLLNASSLLWVWDDRTSTSDEVKVALEPLLRVDPTRVNVSKYRVVAARNEEKVYLKGATTPLQKLDIFGKANIVALTHKVPEFRDWLMSAGWTAEDFLL